MAPSYQGRRGLRGEGTTLPRVPPPNGTVPTTPSLALMVAVVAVYLAALWLPGGMVGSLLGLRGWVLAAVAPVLTYFVVGVGGPLTSAIGLGWSPWVALGVMVVAGVLAFAVGHGGWAGRLLGRIRPSSRPAVVTAGRAPVAASKQPPEAAGGRASEAGGPRAGVYGQLSGVGARVSAWLAARDGAAGPVPVSGRPWTRPVELALAVVVLGVGVAGFATIAGGMGDLSTVPQDWDALFHANGIRYLADTGDAGLYGMAQVNWYGAGPVFYPNAYHLLAAVVYQLTGAPIPLVLNALSALMPGVMALSLVALVRQFGGRAVTAAYSAVIALGATMLVYDNLWRGPLLPFTVGAVTTPVLIILLDRYLRRPALDTGAVFAGAAVGLLALHPSTLFGAVLFAAPLLLQRWWRRSALAGPDLVRLAPPVLAAAVLGAPMLLGALASAGETLTFDWPATFEVSRSVGSLLVFQHDLGGPQLSLAVPLWAGLLTFRRLGSLRWLLGTAALLGFLFVAAASFDNIWVTRLTSPWWNDQYRLIALAAIPLCVIAGHGLAEIQQWLSQLAARLSRGRLRPAPRLSAVMAMLVLAGLGVLSDGFYTSVNASAVARGYAHDTRGTVTRGEVAAFARLAELVKPGERVMNDRGDGTGWMYALAGAHPVAGHFISDHVNPDARLLGEDFTRYDTDPAVRAAAARLNVRYAILGPGFVRDTAYRETGLWSLRDRPFLREVYHSDGVTIYRLIES